MNATNLAVNGELGHVPLSACRNVQVVKYWQRLCNENEDLATYLLERSLFTFKI